MSRKEETIASFEYQWREFPEGKWLLSDPEWRENVADYILDELQTTQQEIKGKLVLDVGSGNGRWAYGYTKLGAKVIGIDTSPSGIKYARENIQGAEFIEMNLVDEQRLLETFGENSFNYVNCWGVLHHLADPARAVRVLARLLKPNGILHAYVYGDKGPVIRFWRGVYQQLTFDQRGALAKMQAEIKEFLQRMPLTEDQKKQLYDILPWAPSAHSNIDQYSPAIADEYDEETVRKWFIDAGLTFTRHTPKWANNSENIFANGVKK